jgi:prepilin peptidase CpaA
MTLLVSVTPLLILLGIAVALDVRTRRIPNWLTLTIVVTGLANAFVHGTPSSPSQSLLGLLVGFGILIVPYVLGAMGAGDVKMLAGVGAWLGPWATAQTYVVAAMAGLAIVLVQSIVTWRLTRLISNSTLIVANFANYAQVGRDAVVVSGRSMQSVDRPLPYAVSTIIGVGVTVAMNLI